MTASTELVRAVVLGAAGDGQASSCVFVAALAVWWRATDVAVAVLAWNTARLNVYAAELGRVAGFIADPEPAGVATQRVEDAGGVPRWHSWADETTVFHPALQGLATR